MTENEHLKIRLEMVQSQLITLVLLATAYLTLLVSVVISTANVGMLQWLGYSVSLLFWISGTAIFSMYLARKYNGIWRQLWSIAFEFEQPPYTEVLNDE